MRPFCGALNRDGEADGAACLVPLVSRGGNGEPVLESYAVFSAIPRNRIHKDDRVVFKHDACEYNRVRRVVERSETDLVGSCSTCAEVVVGVGSVDLTLVGFGTDSSFQNLSEYIGAILAVIGQVVLGVMGSSIALRGDSVTALT